MEENREVYSIVGLVILCIFIYLIVKELTKSKTKITEIVRDEQGRISQVIEKEV